MARIRSIHPGLFTDEAFVSVSDKARILYLGILTESDDRGTFEWKPTMLKMRCLPADNVDAAALLEELAAADMVRRVEVGGRQLGLVRNFCKYQRPKKPSYRFDIPVEFYTYVHLKSDGSPLPPGGGEISPQMEDGGGRRDEETELASASSSRARPLTRDWQQSAESAKRKIAEGWTAEALKLQTPKFITHAIAKNVKFAGQEAADAAFEVWCDRAVTFGEYALRQPGKVGAEPTQFIDIRVGDPEWNAWRSYFADTGKRASVSQMIEAEACGKPFAVESRWPPGHQAQAA